MNILIDFYLVLFTLLDVATASPDKKSIIMYITSLFQVLPHGVSMEALEEVETLPQAVSSKEKHFHFQTQQRYSQQVSSSTLHLVYKNIRPHGRTFSHSYLKFHFLFFCTVGFYKCDTLGSANAPCTWPRRLLLSF